MFRSKHTREERPRGAVGSGLPFDELEALVEHPDTVSDNLENLRPMVEMVRETASTRGWKEVIQPFLDKGKNPARLLELIRDGKDARAEAAKIEIYTSIANVINSILRTGNSMDKIAIEKAAERERLAKEEAEDAE